MNTLNIQDIIPVDTEMTLSEFPGVTFNLKKYTLRDQIWGAKRWNQTEMAEAMSTQNLVVLAAVAWHQLKEKEHFDNNEEAFLEAIVTQTDKFELVTKTLACVGLSMPILKHLEELEKSAEGNAQSPA